jgi:hypothetical protein
MKKEQAEGLSIVRDHAALFCAFAAISGKKKCHLLLFFFCCK